MVSVCRRICKLETGMGPLEDKGIKEHTPANGEFYTDLHNNKGEQNVHLIVVRILSIAA